MTDPISLAPVVTTPRLYLSYLDPESPKHCSLIADLYNSPLFIASEGKTGIDTPEKAKAYIQRRYLAEYKRNGYGAYLISLKPSPTASIEESKTIGTVSLTKGDAPESFPHPDLGFAVLPEQNGKGYATEAAIYLLKYAKVELSVQHVFAFCSAGNKHSGRVSVKAGLEFRGTKALACFEGKDCDVYALSSMNKDLSLYGIKNWNDPST
jgi:RimJ/RimL family protein N-acetyltransferase